jgi:hypothetical protein
MNGMNVQFKALPVALRSHYSYVIRGDRHAVKLGPKEK